MFFEGQFPISPRVALNFFEKLCEITHFKKIPLSPLVLIMTRQNSLSPLVKTMKNLIVTTSGDNEIIITTSGDNMLNTLKTIVLLIWQCYCCLIHLWTMKLSHSCTRNIIFHSCLRHSWNITLLVHLWDNFHCPLVYQTTILHYYWKKSLIGLKMDPELIKRMFQTS